MNIEQERAEFEAWAQNSFELHRHSAGEYSSNFTQTAWAAWQARAALQSQKPEPNDLMLSGVIRMPFEMAMESEISRLQFYQRAQQALNELEALQSQGREDALRLDWLQQSDGRFFKLLHITSIVGRGFSPTNSNDKWFSSLREAIDHARRIEGET